jgi:uncharacterized protein YeaO (DUF488 family)
VEDVETHKIIDVVQFSNEMIKEIEFGFSGHNIKVSPSQSIMRRLKMSEIDVAEFKNKLVQELEQEKENISLFSS